MSAGRNAGGRRSCAGFLMPSLPVGLGVVP